MDYGIDMIISARDQVAPGATKAAATLRQTLGGLAGDFGEGFTGGLSRQLFRGVVHSAIDALDEGMRELANRLTEHWAGLGDEGSGSPAFHAGMKATESFVDGLKSIKVVGAIGELDAAVWDHFLFGDNIAREQAMLHTQEISKAFNELHAKAGQAADSLDDWKRAQQQVNQEEEKWASLERAGMGIVEQKYGALREAERLVKGEQSAIAELDRQMQAELATVHALVQGKRNAAEAAERQARADKEAAAARRELEGAEKRIGDLMEAHKVQSSDDRAYNQALREGTAAIGERYQAALKLAASYAEVVEAGQMRQLQLQQLTQALEDERKAAEDADAARRNGELANEYQRAAESLDDFERAQQLVISGDQKWADQLNRGAELVNQKYDALKRLAEGDEAAQQKLEQQRLDEIENVRLLVQAKRDQEDQERRLRIFSQAEDRLAGINDSGAVRALQFRAQAGDRAARQAAQAPQTSLLVDPRILEGQSKQTAALARVEDILRQVLGRVPDIQVGGA